LHSISTGGDIDDIGALPFHALANTNVLWSLGKPDSGGKILIAIVGQDDIVTVTLGSSPSIDTISSSIMPTGVFGITFLDGFFFYLDALGKIYSTALGGTAFNALTFAAPSGDSSSIIDITSDGNEMWVFFNKSISRWYNAGSGGFPLLRNDNSKISIGLFARLTLIRIGDGFMFLGVGLLGEIDIYITSGYNLKAITPAFLRRKISDLGGNIDWARGASSRGLSGNGLNLYVINFGDSDLGTWVYNIDDGLWSKEASGSLGFSQYVSKGSSGISRRLVGTTTQGQLNLVIRYKNKFSGFSSVINSNEIHNYEFGHNSELANASGSVYSDKNLSMLSKYIVGQDENRMSHSKLRVRFGVQDDEGLPIFVVISYTDDEGATWTSDAAKDIRLTNWLVDLYALGASRKRQYRLTCNYIVNSILKTKMRLSVISSYLIVKQLKS